MVIFDMYRYHSYLSLAPFTRKPSRLGCPRLLRYSDLPSGNNDMLLCYSIGIRISRKRSLSNMHMVCACQLTGSSLSAPFR